MTISFVSAGGVTNNGPYSTLASWAVDVNAASLSGNHVSEVSGTISDTAKVTVSGWTANGFTVTLRAASGQGVSAGGAARHLTSGRATLTNSIQYDLAYTVGGGLILQDVQVRASDFRCSNVIQLSGSSTVERCIVSVGGSGSTKGVIASSGGGTVKSTLFIMNGGNGTDEFDTLNLLRCTFIGNGSGTGIASRYGSQRAQGCIVYNFATNFSGTAAASSSHNATDKATFAGTGWGTSGQTSLSSSDFVSTTGGSEDYSAASGSTKLKDTGTAISGVTVDLFNVSIPQNGTADIGATEVSAGGGGGGGGPLVRGPILSHLLYGRGLR